MIALLPTLALALPPQVTNTVVATYSESVVQLRGANLGTPSADHELLVESGGHIRRMPSTHANVQLWTDDRIEVLLPPGTPSGRLRVLTPDGVSVEVEVAVFDYDWYDIPPTPGTNPSPLSITVDSAQRVWVNQEFHLELQLLDPSVGAVTGLPLPQPAGPGPFANTIFSDHQTQTSVLGEEVLEDPSGRIWFTQGGGYLYSGAHPNHSRVVMVLPDEVGGPQFRVYNVPGDWNEVVGAEWDDGRGWLWFAQGGLTAGAKITGFDPDLIAWDNTFEFDVSLNHQICGVGNPGDPCYHTYDLPNPTAQPAHLYIDNAGYVWYTAFWGNAIGRLNPATGVVNEYPLSAHISQAEPAIYVGAGPWEILGLPDGDIVFNEFFDATLVRFDTSRADDPACLTLDLAGQNPCMVDRVIPDADPVDEQLHSIALDLAGNLWYSIHTADVPGLGGSVGYLTPDGEMTRLPPLDDFPGTGAGTVAGIAVDPVDGDLWLAEFWRKRVGHLTRVPELP